jgi:hypothetical protein
MNHHVLQHQSLDTFFHKRELKSYRCNLDREIGSMLTKDTLTLMLYMSFWIGLLDLTQISYYYSQSYFNLVCVTQIQRRLVLSINF